MRNFLIFLLAFLAKIRIKGAVTYIMQREKQFENQVKRYLESIGVYSLGTPRDKMPVEPIGYYEKRWGGMMTKSGLPDLHVCIHGHSIEVELKAETGRLSEMQKFMMHQINMSGGKAIVVYPADFDKFKDLVETYL